MQINHNLISTNIANNMKKTSKNESKSSEKLSSGLRINRSGDDAAGLSISEKMRALIRGLDQASRNTQDGMSLIQTAEGGMNEITSILQRCRELSVQSANDTYSNDDRDAMQDELNQLVKQVDTIANSTTFNDLSLLNGRYDKDGNMITTDSLKDSVQYVTTSGGVTDTYTYGGNTYASAKIDFSNITSQSDVDKLVGKGFSYTCCTCDRFYSIKFVKGTPDTSRLNSYDPVMEVDVSSITNGSDLVNKIIETAYGQSGYIYDPTTSDGDGLPDISKLPSNASSFVNHYSQLAFSGSNLYIYDERPDEANQTWPSNGNGTFNLSVYDDGKDNLFFNLDLQVGANAGESVHLQLYNITVDQLGLNDLLVNTRENANSSMTKLFNAIKKASTARSSLGAYENRLEHIIALSDNYSENLQNAESRIRDVDMAKEELEMSKNNILQQVASSLLNQSNQMPDRILDLLK